MGLYMNPTQMTPPSFPPPEGLGPVWSGRALPQPWLGSLSGRQQWGAQLKRTPDPELGSCFYPPENRPHTPGYVLLPDGSVTCVLPVCYTRFGSSLLLFPSPALIGYICSLTILSQIAPFPPSSPPLLSFVLRASFPQELVQPNRNPVVRAAQQEGRCRSLGMRLTRVREERGVARDCN